MKKYLLLVCLFAFPFLIKAQENTVQNANTPKDAPVDVTVTDLKNNLRPNEIIVFKSSVNEREYQGITDDNGKFSLRLPAGANYEIFILGFKDSVSYIMLEIPGLTGNAYYKNPFKVDIQFQPSRTFVLDDCNFETGKATLEESSYTVLNELVAYLVRKDDERIELGGHTDNVGSAASNLKLSLDRANAVRDYILSKGIAAERVYAKGYGMTVPVADNKTADGRAQNRRTEVRILE